ncbi:hypothetical protein ABK040_005286 [Willaertia magna]
MKQETIFKTQIDELNNHLIIPTNKTNNYLYSSTDFEIYLSGISKKGGLMVDNEKYCKERTFPYFIKFTKENIPIPLLNEEYVEFIRCGLQHLIIATNLSKCYLFGDFQFEDYNPNHLILGQQLLFKLNNGDLINNQLNYKITHLDCGEQYVIVKDELNNFWFAGRTNFGNGHDIFYEFNKLNGGQLLNDLNKNSLITRVVAGGRHLAVCMNDQFIYTIGNNYYNQLGIKKKSEIKIYPNVEVNNLNEMSFVKAEWNLNGEYKVKELTCSGNATIILTKCGRIFKTLQSQELLSQINLINIPIITIGTEWNGALVLLQNNKFYKLSDYKSEYSENCFLIENANLMDIKLSTGTGSADEMFACYTDNQVKFTEGSYEVLISPKTYELRTNLPIVHVQLSEEIYLVYCCKKKVNEFQSKLFKTKGLTDITINY